MDLAQELYSLNADCFHQHCAHVCCTLMLLMVHHDLCSRHLDVCIRQVIVVMELPQHSTPSSTTQHVKQLEGQQDTASAAASSSGIASSSHGNSGTLQLLGNSDALRTHFGGSVHGSGKRVEIVSLPGCPPPDSSSG